MVRSLVLAHVLHLSIYVWLANGAHSTHHKLNFAQPSSFVFIDFVILFHSLGTTTLIPLA